MLEHQISTENMALLKQSQQNEIDEYHIYQAIASTLKNEKDRKTLLRIADAEHQHADRWQKYTQTSAKPNRKKFGSIRWLQKYLAIPLR